VVKLFGAKVRCARYLGLFPGFLMFNMSYSKFID
jgi:hypothetical protein